MQVQPYLFFDGRCDEALEFYKKAIGADVKMVMRWKDSPDKNMCTPGNADKVMHAQFPALGDGGQVTMPLGKTFFSPRFGMLADKFGVHWMILVPQH